MNLFQHIPGFIRKFIWWKLRKNAFFAKKTKGTVMVTSVGMIGKFPGWAIPIGLHTLIITLTGIVKKQVIIDNISTTREFLKMTISVDHDIVDGAPFTQFISRLSDLVETAYELDSIMPIQRVITRQQFLLKAT